MNDKQKRAYLIAKLSAVAPQAKVEFSTSKMSGTMFKNPITVNGQKFELNSLYDRSTGTGFRDFLAMRGII